MGIWDLVGTGNEELRRENLPTVTNLDDIYNFNVNFYQQLPINVIN